MNVVVNLFGWIGALILLWLIYVQVRAAQEDFDASFDQLGLGKKD